MDTIDFLESCPINPIDARVFGYAVAPYIFLAKRQEAVDRMLEDQEHHRGYFQFESWREVIEAKTGLTLSEQLEIEKYLTYLNVIEVEEKGNGYLKIHLNHEVYDCIYHSPERFIKLQNEILNK